jgi:hypothetical protein
VKRFKLALFVLLAFSVLRVALAVDPAPNATPAPAIRTQFVLPLADGTSATAVCLPGQSGQLLLVYIAGGKLVTGSIVLDGSPITPPVVDPPPVVVPPIVVPPIVPPVDPVGKPAALIVITDKSVSNPIWKSSEVVSFLNAKKLPPTYEYNLSLVDDPNADPNALKWIGKSAIANNAYPYYFWVTEKGEILEQGPLSSLKASELVAILGKHSAQGGKR